MFYRSDIEADKRVMKD